MNRSLAALAALAALVALTMTPVAGCCFGGGTGGGGFTVTGPTTSVAPGFSPDPMLLSGAAGGPTDASTWSPSCRGHVSMIPGHTLSVTGMIPQLRIMAHSDTDTTIVVQRPDGSYVCNDDSDGLDPAVDLSGVAPGNYNVYVGTYSPGGSAPYQLGITTNMGITPSTMTQPVGGPTMGGGAPGAVLRSGTATVALVTGNLPGVAAGSTCTYTQTSVDASQFGFDCRWDVVCNGVEVYGGGQGGYAPCSDPAWPPGTLVADTGTSGVDRDPSLVINAGGMMVRDDAQGARGEFSITATLAPMPIPPG